MRSRSGLIPARFLTLAAHAVITIAALWSRDENVQACVPVPYTDDEYSEKDTELIIGLSVSLGLFAFELVGFLGGISMFAPLQGLISTAAHTAGAVTMAYFLSDAWECQTYWWIFGFCCALPAVTEIIVIVGVLAFRKGL